MIKAFISHSSEQKDFATKLVNLLGRDYCKIDCYNFESAYKSINEIYEAIDSSTIFVLLISQASLKSKWVKEEIRYARKKLQNNQYERFWPFIIDESINVEDCPKWMRDKESFNLRKILSPYVLKRDIEQKFRKIVWSENETLKTIETTMVGRNNEISSFEEKFQSSIGLHLRALIVSGREGVGKETFSKQCMYKVGYALEQEPYRIDMDVKEGIENFLLYLNMILLKYRDNELEEIYTRTPKEKSKVAVQLLNELYSTRSIVFIHDNMSCILPNRNIAEWLIDIIEDPDLNNQMGMYIQSRITPITYIEVAHPKVVHIPLLPLNKKDRLKLFYSYMRVYELNNISDDDVLFFVDKLLYSPIQLKQAIETIRSKSLIMAKREIETLVAIGDKKVRFFIDRYKSDEGIHLLIILSKFDFISYEILEDIFGERTKEVLETLYDMMIYGIVSSFGHSEQYFRLDNHIGDYIRRNKFTLPKDLDIHIREILENKLANEELITEDTSLYLYNIKQTIMSGKGTKSSFLIPSVVIKTVMEAYNNQDYPQVIEICDKVLQETHSYYDDVVRELTYWQCLAFCRLQLADRFYDAVKNINGADHLFLKGFYKRIETDFPSAERLLRQALEQSPKMQRAKRELVTSLMAQNKYEKAIELAEENFKHDPDNTYHTHAYFRCIIKNRRLSRDDIEMLNLLMGRIKDGHMDENKKEELLAAMNIEYQAYVLRKSPSYMIEYISDLEKRFSRSNNIKRAAQDYRIVQSLVSRRDIVRIPED